MIHLVMTDIYKAKSFSPNSLFEKMNFQSTGTDTDTGTATGPCIELAVCP